MKYIKMEDGWLVLETGIKIPFGELIVSLTNFWNEKINEHHNKMRKLIKQGYTFKDKELQNLDPYISEHYDIICRFTETMHTYLVYQKGNISHSKFSYTGDNDERFNKQTETIKTLYDNGWFDIPVDEVIDEIDLFLLNEQKAAPPIMVTSHLINHKWYPGYEVTPENSAYLAFLDLQEVRNIDGIDFSYCQYCEKIYIKRTNKSKYCPECSRNYKAINDALRKNTPRGLHQKVSNYLRNSNKFTADEQSDFINESNYYWDVLNGKDSLPKKNHYLEITTVDEYIDWLQKKHNYFKETSRDRKKI